MPGWDRISFQDKPAHRLNNCVVRQSEIVRGLFFVTFVNLLKIRKTRFPEADT